MKLIFWLLLRPRNKSKQQLYVRLCLCGIRMIDGFGRTMSGIRVIVYSSDKGNNYIKICGQ
jgi:hypothetical protein